MALNTPFLAAMLALAAATCWGSGDFVGGLATRRFGTFRSILVIFSVGMVTLVILAVIRVEPLPPLADLVCGTLAGLLGLGFLFRGFAGALVEVWAEELVSDVRIELENLFDLEAQTIDRGENAGALNGSDAPRMIQRVTLRVSKQLKQRLNHSGELYE